MRREQSADSSKVWSPAEAGQALPLFTVHRSFAGTYRAVRTSCRSVPPSPLTARMPKGLRTSPRCFSNRTVASQNESRAAEPCILGLNDARRCPCSLSSSVYACRVSLLALSRCRTSVPPPVGKCGTVFARTYSSTHALGAGACVKS